MKEPSGRFVVRIPPSLHGRMRNDASDRGISLNEWCRQALATCLTDQDAAPALAGEEADWVRTASAVLGENLLGVVLFGSSARGEASAGSDIDLLIVANSSVALSRRLYSEWDATNPNPTVNPHFVRVPQNVIAAGSLWYEVAIDGIILLENGRRVTDFLRNVRRAIADRLIERKDAYGHGYWIKHEPVAVHAQ